MFKKLPTLFLVAFASFGIGFANQLLISKYFGTSVKLDIYWLLLSAINFLCFYVFPLRDAVAPIFYKELKDRSEASLLASASVSLCLYMTIGELALLFGLTFMANLNILPQYLVSDSGSIQIALWLLPSIFLLAAVEIMAGLLLSLNLPVEQALCRLIAPIATFLLLIIFAETWGELTLAIGFTIANILVMLASVFLLNKADIKLQFVAPRLLLRPEIKNMFFTMTLVYIFAQANVLFERYVFLQFGPGVISGFQYAFMLVGSIIGLIAGPVGNLLWPIFMAINHDEKDHRQEKIFDSLWVYLGLPLTLLAIFIFNNAQPIIYFIFYRGEFDLQSVEMSSLALRFLIFGIIPACLSQVVGRLLNAQNKFLSIGTISITMAFTGIFLLMISLIQINLNLAFSQWLITNIIGATICMFAGYWYLGGRRFLNWSRLKLIIKLASITIAANLLSPQVSITSSKFSLGLDLATYFVIYMLPLLLALVLLNRSYFPVATYFFNRSNK